MLHHELLMSLCIKKAWEFQTLTLPNPAVGAMVVDHNGRIIALEAHQKSGGAHAEILALKQAYIKLSGDDSIQSIHHSDALHHFLATHHKNIFHSCTIYVTLEPCTCHGKTPPCASILQVIKPKQVIIGALEQTKNKGGLEQLKQSGIQVISKVLEQECQKLLYPFKTFQTTHRFNLFKLAQRLNGDYKSGTISSLESKIFSHNQRSVSNKIFISRKTLEYDNPLLDSRLATPPFEKQKIDIGIFSKNHTPLQKHYKIFQTQRNITLYHDSSPLAKGFNIIEGGWELFESLQQQIDMLLIHLSPTLKVPTKTHGFQYQNKILYHNKIGEDVLLWIQNS